MYEIFQKKNCAIMAYNGLVIWNSDEKTMS